MQTNNVKEITNGAIAVALFIILLNVSFYVPIIGFVTSLLLPLPIIMYGIKNSIKYTSIVAIASVIISFLVGGIMSLVFALAYAAFGAVVGISIKEKKSWLLTFGSASIAFLIAVVIDYVLTIFVLGINVVEVTFKRLNAMYDVVGEVGKQQGVLPENYDKLIADSLRIMEMTTPSYVIIAVFITTFIVIQINYYALKKWKIDVPKFPTFSHLRLPKSIMWYYLIVLIMTMTMELQEGSYLSLVVANAMLLLRTLLFLQGISVVYYFLNRFKGKLIYKILATILAIPFTHLVTLIGLIDLGFNIRTFSVNSKKK